MKTVQATCVLLVIGVLLQGCSTPQNSPSQAHPSNAPVPDAIRTNPEKYTVVMENDRVRVLDYRDKPGERTALHHHPDFVLVVISPFARRMTLPDGSSRERVFRAGEVIPMKAESHIGENIGTTETHALLVEMK